MSKRDRHDPRAKKLVFMMGGQWIARPLAMLESPAWQVLSLLERRFIDRLEIEYGRNAGRENGRLIVTYDQFTEGGIKRDYIAAAQRVCVKLGFVDITAHGQGGPARRPNLYRLTYQNVTGNGVYREATNEWRFIKTVQEAKAIAENARGDEAKTAVRENRFLVPKKGTPLVPKKGTPLPPKSPDSDGSLGPQKGDYLLYMQGQGGVLGGVPVGRGASSPPERHPLHLASASEPLASLPPRHRRSSTCIIETLKANPFGLGTVDIMKAAGIANRNRADVMLHYLHGKGIIERPSRGWYGLPGAHEAWKRARYGNGQLST